LKIGGERQVGQIEKENVLEKALRLVLEKRQMEGNTKSL